MNKIVKITPAYKDYLWGGTKLKEYYNKKSDLDIIAESWEVSTHKDGSSLVEGIKLKDYIENNKGILGSKGKGDNLPILIKLIDAKNELSIQVHPDNDYALSHEGDNGKTEMWYIIECDEGSFLYAGVNKEMSKIELEESIKDGSITDKLNKIYIKQGDVLFINPGTIHAIGKGIVIYEIQQQSNVTYRLYDFKRKDDQGNTRELHVDKSMDVSNLKPQEWNLKEDAVLLENETQKISKLRSCKYFSVYKYDIKEEIEMSITDESIVFITLLEGEGVIKGENSVEVIKGDTVMIPAHNGKVLFKGNGKYIYSTL